MNWGLVEGQEHLSLRKWGMAGADPQTMEMRAFVTASNKLRTSCAALTRDEVKFVHEDGQNTILAFVRYTEQLAALCVVHLGESQWENDSYGAPRLLAHSLGMTWKGEHRLGESQMDLGAELPSC